VTRVVLDTNVQSVKEMYQDRVVEADVAIDELADRLTARASRSGWVLSQFDSIAATAVEKGARLATRISSGCGLQIRNAVDERWFQCFALDWDA
jgi:hypothetical protein